MLQAQHLILFDVDGTLTPARQPMTDSFVEFFTEWSTHKLVYLVSGSDYEKLQDQVPCQILENTSGVFGCMGNTYHVHGHRMFKRLFDPPEALLAILNLYVSTSEYPVRTGNHIEERVGMLNFSIVGRNASLDQRKNYFEYDAIHHEREEIAQKINERFSGIEASVGGEISIDVYPSGADKSQVLSYLPIGRYVFFGDKMESGGNDHALAKALENTGNSVLHSVETYQDTRKIIKENYL